MNKKNLAHFIFVSFVLLPQGWAKTAPQTEIHVTLLGQPCRLQGPHDAATLKTIHSLGPAQIYPNLNLGDSASRDETSKALEKVRKTNGLPFFEGYRAKLIKRLEAQLGFLEAFETFKAKRQPTPLVEIAKKYLRKDRPKFEGMIKKLGSISRSSPQYRDYIETLFDFYNESIEPDPEEDFHRATKAMEVQYSCSFEESEEALSD